MQPRIGVALILFRDVGREEIFFLREKKSKPEIAKVAGQLSIPMETVEMAESPDSAMQRLLAEEVGVPTTPPHHIGCARRVCGPGATVVCDIHVYVATAVIGPWRVPTDPDDVEIVGWRPVSCLMSLGEAGRHELPHIARLLHNKEP